MSKQDEAGLILKLYELRREEVMRKARDWYFGNFNPQSFEDIKSTMMGPQSAYLRMVVSYWDMAAAMVNHGAISQEFFTDTNGEHLATYAKIEPFIEECRTTFAPQFAKNMEHLVDQTPHGRERTAKIRERMKWVVEERKKRQQQDQPAPVGA
jgi:hypothetical protein